MTKTLETDGRAQFFDLCDELLDEVVGGDPLVCQQLSLLGGIGVSVPGVIGINTQGDVFVLGEPFWDCPPYDLFPPR